MEARVDEETGFIVDERHEGVFLTDNIVVDLYLPKIGCIAYTVYSYFCRLASKDGGDCFPSFSKIEKACGISKPTVIKSVNSLIEHGLIAKQTRERKDGGYSSNGYRILKIQAKGSKGDLLPLSTSLYPPCKSGSTSILCTHTDPIHENADCIDTKQKQPDETFEERRGRLLGRKNGSAASYTPPSERKSNPVEDKITKILCLYETLLKYPVPNVNEQRYHIMQMLNDGYTVEDIIGCYKTLKKDDFWKSKTLTMKLVETNIGNYLKKENEKNAWMKTLPHQPTLPPDAYSTPEKWVEATKNGW